MIQKYPIQRVMAEKNRRQLAVYSGGGSSATVSLQFLKKHHKSNCHTKSHFRK